MSMSLTSSAFCKASFVLSVNVRGLSDMVVVVVDTCQATVWFGFVVWFGSVWFGLLLLLVVG